jgi:trimeric autotransporter adhesin
MNHADITKILISLFAVVLCFGPVGLADPIGPAFTYQGRLIDANNAANGLYDFQFKLFNASTDGNQVGTDVNISDVDVIDGYFTAELDFGSAFDGNERWLDIGVRPGEIEDPNAYTALSPRQKITPSPYALHALNNTGSTATWQTNGSAVYYNDGNVGIGTSAPADKLDVAGHINASKSYKLDGVTVLDNNGTANIFVGGSSGVSNTSGYSNTAVGFYTLYINTAGHMNTAVGNGALGENTTGNANSAVGYSALFANTEGEWNCALGYYALSSNTTGGDNSAVGAAALASNTTGNGNSAFGDSTLVNNTEGQYNSAFGTLALRSNINGTGNTAAGSYSLYTSTAGNYNAAVGYSALTLNVTGNTNTALGSYAGSDCLGSGNVFLGYSAGSDETGSDKLYIANSGGMPLIYGDFSTDRVGIGTITPAAALDVNGQIKISGGSPGTGKVLTSNAAGLATWQTPVSTGDNLGDHIAKQNIQLNANWLSGDGGNEGVYVANDGNVGIGQSSPANKLDVSGHINSTESYKLDGTTVLVNTGTGNIYVGANAGVSSTGSYNVFAGSSAGYSNLGGYRNTFLGHEAGYSNTTANYNTALGDSALHNSSTGGWNAAVGSSALYYNTANYNSALGSGALFNNTSGVGNSALGRDALSDNTTANYSTAIGYAALTNSTGAGNTAIGASAGFNCTGGGNVFLGYLAGYNETGSNKLYIANTQINPPLIYGDFSTGRVGIRTTTPAGTLDVNGPIYQRGALLHADYVFEPSYKLESIEQHSKLMWQGKHLPSLSPRKLDESGQEIIEIGSHQRGIVEELEKAHVYIEQLNKENTELKAKMELLAARLESLESKMSIQHGGIK